MKKTLFIIIGSILTIFLVLFLLRSLTPEDTWICANGNWIKHGNPKNPPPTTGCGETETNSANQNRLGLSKITITQPEANTIVGKSFNVIGQAQVFENQFNWQIIDPYGEILIEGTAEATVTESEEWGNYIFKVNLPTNTPPKIVLQVFDYSAKDGSIIDLTEVDLNYVP